MDRVAFLLVVAMTLGPVTSQRDSFARLTPTHILLTVYSTRGPRMLQVPGRKSWCGWLWVDHHKIGRIMPGQFLTVKLTDRDHHLAGEAFFARESSIQTTITPRGERRYFMRLIIESKAVAGFGPTRWIGEEVTCKEAYGEAATLEPVKLKRIERSYLDDTVRESYFPECTE